MSLTLSAATPRWIIWAHSTDPEGLDRFKPSERVTAPSTRARWADGVAVAQHRPSSLVETRTTI